MFFVCSAIWAQPGTISTFAGKAIDKGPAATFPLLGPSSLSLDQEGNLYIAEQEALIRVSTNGQAEALLRSRDNVCSGDVIDPQIPSKMRFLGIGHGLNGTMWAIDVCRGLYRMNEAGTFRRFFQWGSDVQSPVALAAGPNGSVYVTLRHQVVRLLADGTQSIVAGTGTEGFGGDGGPGREAKLSYPQGVAVSVDGSVFIADYRNYRIRKVSPDGTITTVAGNGQPPRDYTKSLPADEGRIGAISNLVLDGTGKLYFAEVSRIRRLDPDGQITTFAGSGRFESSGDGGPAVAASFLSPGGMVISRDGSLFVADALAHNVRRIDAEGNISTYVGEPIGSNLPGPVTRARLVDVSALAFDQMGNLYVVDDSGFRLLKIDISGRAAVIFERRRHFIDQLFHEACLAIDSGGAIYGCTGGMVWKLNEDGSVTTVAGQSATGNSGDGGAATSARLRIPAFLCFTADKSLLIVDRGSHVVRKVSPEGIITTVAGTGVAGFSGDDGPAAAASLNVPYSVAADPDGTIYVADTYNHRVRKITPAGIIKTVAGDGAARYPTYGTLAAKTNVSYPYFVAVDTSGNVYFNGSPGEVAKLAKDSYLYRVAGLPRKNYPNVGLRFDSAPSGDGGPALNAQLGVWIVAVDPRNNVFVSDKYSFIRGLIRRIEGASPFTATPNGLVFATVLTAPPQFQDISISSSDGDERRFVIQSTVNWLQVSPAVGTVKEKENFNVRVTTLPLARPGYYQGKITITDTVTQEATTVPVTLLVSSSPQQMKLGQTGLTFNAPAQAGATPPASQTLPVLNTGIGRMDWTAGASTLSGGNWLEVANATGNSEAGKAAPNNTVSVKPAGLTAGAYFGLVTVKSTQADNSPQSAVVVLNVVPPATTNSAVISPQGAVFVAAQSSAAPTPVESIQVLNPANRTITFTATIAYPNNRGSWVRLSETTGSINAGASTTLNISALPGDLAPGAYNATVNLRFAPDNTTQSINLLLVVTDGPVITGKPGENRLIGACVPTKLLPVFRAPGGNFTVSAGWPMAVELVAVDDCGNPVNTGRAVVSSSLGAAPLSLSAVGNGRWTGTWTSGIAKAGRLSLTTRLEQANPVLVGEAKMDGTLRDNPDQPAVDRGGLLNYARPSPETLVGSGSLVSVVGSKMAKDTQAVESGNWPSLLAETRAIIAGVPVPLRQVSDGRLDAIVPLGIPENTRHQLVVQRGKAYSQPEEVLITSAAPTVLTVDNTGRNQGHIYVQEADGLRLADSARPALPGETLIVMATGLGATTPALAAGELAPADPVAKVSKSISVSIEGIAAEVYYAILEPGQVGVYRIAVKLPDGIKVSSAARLLVQVDGVESTFVTFATSEPPPIE